ncbi:putative membrane protein [Erysiphe neolycopersici]|uniref:Putative membrane protein n=1 Tax=Erysiphe neolycopersici TaxID=212602 RepID=A0A420I4K1_9PEZI|nr:putative membrane protein [Erysiphe neolycopersici]
MNLFGAKIISSIAATTISLAGGTNYVYSAWGPQFADKLNYSSTEENIIGLSANLGMYLLGIPIGIFVDSNGARITVLYAGLLLGTGYFILYNAYSNGSGYLPLLCVFSFLTGVGGCASLATAVKVSVMNWPENKGTATAFPVAAFGLSAFLFSSFGQLVVSGNTSSLLLILAIGTFGLNYIGFPFLRIIQAPEITPVVSRNYLIKNQLHSTRADDIASDFQQALVNEDLWAGGSGTDETTILLSDAAHLNPRDVHENSSCGNDLSLKIRGLKLLTHAEFWQLFSLMGILTGIALMTINNIGNNVKALWRHWDESKDEVFIIQQESLQVSIISIASFLGRIASGIGSDFLVKILKVSRLWCLVFASTLFFVAQIFAITVTDPRMLFLVTAPTGLAYGFVFGCFPSLVSEAFGIHSLSENLGSMLLSPIISGNILNLLYGKIYDRQSVIGPNGHRECTKGISCYQKAYYMTILASIAGFTVSLSSIFHAYRLRQSSYKLVNREQDEDEDAA